MSQKHVSLQLQPPGCHFLIVPMLVVTRLEGFEGGSGRRMSCAEWTFALGILSSYPQLMTGCPIISETHSISVPLPFSEGDWIARVELIFSWGEVYPPGGKNIPHKHLKCLVGRDVWTFPPEGYTLDDILGKSKRHCSSIQYIHWCMHRCIPRGFGKGPGLPRSTISTWIYWTFTSKTNNGISR